MADHIPIKTFGASRPAILLFSILTISSWVAVLLRCYTRIKLVRFWGWDDTLTVVALVSLKIISCCGVSTDQQSADVHSRDYLRSYLCFNHWRQTDAGGQ